MKDAASKGGSRFAEKSEGRWLLRGRALACAVFQRRRGSAEKGESGLAREEEREQREQSADGAGENSLSKEKGGRRRRRRKAPRACIGALGPTNQARIRR